MFILPHLSQLYDTSKTRVSLVSRQCKSQSALVRVQHLDNFSNRSRTSYCIQILYGYYCMTMAGSQTHTSYSTGIRYRYIHHTYQAKFAWSNHCILCRIDASQRLGVAKQYRRRIVNTAISILWWTRVASCVDTCILGELRRFEDATMNTFKHN